MKISKPICAAELTPAAIDRIAKRMMELDEIVGVKGNGCYTARPEERAPRYRIKQMCEYATKVKKSVSELSDNELEMFLVK